MKPPAIEAWRRIAETGDPAGLDALLAEDVVFISPVVHKPQRGKPIAKAYLGAALKALGRDSFRYVGEWYAEGSAVLEFNLEADGVEIDGADFIAWDLEGRITEFKVMVRPLKAIEWVRQAMAAMLQTAKG